MNKWALKKIASEVKNFVDKTTVAVDRRLKKKICCSSKGTGRVFCLSLISKTSYLSKYQLLNFVLESEKPELLFLRN
ncbi:unnamed protein product [Rotaria magnacalcarata]